MAITPTQDQSDPWGWNAWAQTQDPGTYGFASTALNKTNVLGNKALLTQAGLWNDSWDQLSQLNGQGHSITPDDINVDLSSLAGYQTQSAKGPGYYTLSQLLDPSGNVVSKSANQSTNSMHAGDYLAAAAVMGGGYLAGSALGAAGIGEGVGATAAADSGSLGSLAFNAPEVSPVAYNPSEFAGVTNVVGGNSGYGATAAGAGIGSGDVVVPAATTSTATVAAPEAVAGAGGVAAPVAATTAGGSAAPALDMASMNASGGISTTAGTAAAGTTGAGSSALSSLGDMNLGQWAQLGTSLYGLYQGNQMMQMGANADPFAAYRGQYAQMLQQLMMNPSSVTSLPGYTAGLDQATQTLTRQSASQGLTGSGTTAAALANAGANYQGTYFNNYLSQLAGLAGAGSTGANGSMAGFAAGSNTQNQSLQNLMKIFAATGG